MAETEVPLLCPAVATSTDLTAEMTDSGDWTRPHPPLWTAAERNPNKIKSDGRVRNKGHFHMSRPTYSLVSSSEDFKRLAELLEHEHKGIVAVCGPRGAGNTALARRYAWQRRATFHHNVLWIHAACAQDIRDSLDRIHRRIAIASRPLSHLQDVPAAFQTLYDYFSANKCLFIFDGAESLNHIYEYLPAEDYPDIQVLVTSQSQDWGNIQCITLHDSHSETAIANDYRPEDTAALEDIAKLFCQELIINSVVIREENIEVLENDTSHVETEKIAAPSQFFQSLIEGHIDMVDHFIRNGELINAKGWRNLTPIQIATINGHEHIVKMLLKRQVQLNALNLLHLALSNCRKAIAYQLLRAGVPMEEPGDDGNYPLHLCLDNGYAELTLRMLHLGVSVNSRNRSGDTPLHIAINKNCDTVIDDLIESCADINAANNEGQTPLHIAVEQNNNMLTRTLLENKAIVNCVDKNGTTPLYLATANGNLSMIQDLVNNGALVLAGNQRNALLLAIDQKNLDALKYLTTCLLEKELDFGNRANADIQIENTKSKRVYNDDRTEFVEGEWSNGHLVKLDYAEFTTKGSQSFRLYGKDNLLTISVDCFVARYKILEPLHIKFDSFTIIKRLLLSKLSIEQILNDDLANRISSCKKNFESILDNGSKNESAVQDILYLEHISKTCKWMSDIDILKKISKNHNISQTLKSAVLDLLQLEQRRNERKNIIPCSNFQDASFDIKSLIAKYAANAVKSRKHFVGTIISSTSIIPDAVADINSLPSHLALLLDMTDVKFFQDLNISTTQHSYPSDTIKNDVTKFLRTFVSQLWQNYFDVFKREHHRRKHSTQLTNTIFLPIYKTCIDLLSEISEKHNLSVEDVLGIGSNGNLFLKNIETESEDLFMLKSQIKFVLELMAHFKPAENNKKPFCYKFCMFEKSSSWSSITKFVTNFFDFSPNGLSEINLIWLYYIHNSFNALFQHKNMFTSDHANVGNMFTSINCLLHLFKKVIDNTTHAPEKLRILAHSIVKFGYLLTPKLLNSSLNCDSSVNVLLQQAEYITKLINSNEATADVSSIIVNYNIFWDQYDKIHTTVSNTFTSEPLLLQSQSILSDILSIFYSISNLKLYSDKFVIFLRSYNEFMKYLSGIKFSWYIKKNQSLLTTSSAEINGEKQSYEVTDVDKYITEWNEAHMEIPRHYGFEAVRRLIQCVDASVKSTKWSVEERIQAASELTLAIGRSLIFFREQPSYEDYENFLRASTEPFYRVLENSASFAELKTRIATVENYYVYTRDLSAISVEKALDMYEESIPEMSDLDFKLDRAELSTCYQTYIKHFNDHIEKQTSNEECRLQQIVAEVKASVIRKPVAEWDGEFKRSAVAATLGGLSAAWSVQASRDVRGQQQTIKPHGVQVLCVLRLLGADAADTGVRSHLAQVLTGQGKSLVLGLLAATLALTGNAVRIVCYNEYLAERDRDALAPFYSLFGIKNRIEYGTFRDIAEEAINPTIDLRDFVENLLTNNVNKSSIRQHNRNRTKNTALLIDEVDVFFSPLFYGNTYNPVTVISTTSVANFQTQIWNMAKSGANKSFIKHKIYKFIENENFDTKLQKLLASSKNIFDKELDKMITDAICVVQGNTQDYFIYKYKLDEMGYVVWLNDDGKYVRRTWISYYNLFNYFRLKQKDFDHKDFQNFGYIKITCGAVSYALLPKEYPTILGVTGTLTTLSEVECQAVRSYNITKASAMPSFFGRHKLKFEPKRDFRIADSENEWQATILSRLVAQVNRGRAVIVFFDTEFQIAAVRRSAERHVARVHVLTGNEAAAELERCVQEAGVARTLTLATRHMGRGVDFTANDSTVQDNGGVHVIQTFFSEDVKEQVQIQGRTARKDNKGSYELILCREHLKAQEYSRTSADAPVQSYADLHEIRKSKARENEKTVANNIESSKKQHEMTMDFIKSIYNYDPKNRHSYFSKYPFVQ